LRCNWPKRAELSKEDDTAFSFQAWQTSKKEGSAFAGADRSGVPYGVRRKLRRALSTSRQIQRQSAFFAFPLPETKKPAAGGGAAGFRKEPNSNWEEECCSSHKRPREEDKVACKSETMREEVHRFDKFIIRETCLLHRHLFAQQPCAMRKAGSSLVTSQTEKCPAQMEKAKNKSARSKEAGACRMSLINQRF
jgi:hypothetical protein